METKEGRTEIIVSGRPEKVEGHYVTYQQIVDLWNKIHEEEGVQIQGTPGIDYSDGDEQEDGVLEPGEKMKVKDGTNFTVDSEHVS